MKLHLFSFLLLLTTTTQAQQPLTPEQLEQDLRFVAQVINTLHPNHHRYSNPAYRDSILQQEIKTYKQNPGPPQAYNAISRMVASAYDIHTYMRSKAPVKEDSLRLLPFRMRVMEDYSLVVAELLGDSIGIGKGDLIKSINNQPAQQIIDDISKLRSADGFTRTFMKRLAGLNFTTYYNLLYGYQDSFHIIYHSLSRNQWREIHCRAQSMQERKAWIKNQEEKKKSTTPPTTTSTTKTPKVIFKTKNQRFFYSTLDTTIAVIDMNKVDASRWRRFYRRSFQHISKTKPKALVIDLRDNTGGNVDNFMRLLSYTQSSNPSFVLIRDQPAQNKLLPLWSRFQRLKAVFIFETFTKRHPESTKQIKKRVYTKKKRNKYHYAGPIYVLTNGLTASASSHIATLLQKENRATIVGEETGGGAFGCGAFSYIKVRCPQSRYTFQMPLWRMSDERPGTDTGRGVQPDIPIYLTREDLAKPTDRGMAKIVELLNSAP